MPRGQSPSSLMATRYKSLSKQLDRAESEFQSGTLLKQLRNKIEGFVYGEDGAQDRREQRTSGQRAIPAKHYSLLKRVEKMEDNMRKKNDAGE